MISLIVTIIVMIILASFFIANLNKSPDQAAYARFIQELSNVQDGVYSTRIQNSKNGDSEEKINAGFNKIKIEKEGAPSEFESFGSSGDYLIGYIVNLETISYANAERGKKYSEYVTESGETSDEVLEFGKDDVYVYDASGTVYYLKGLFYNDVNIHSIESAGSGLTSTEDGPIISSVTVESGELDNGTRTSAIAKIIVSASPRYGGKLTVLVRNLKANEQPNGTYVAQVSKNGVYAIIVTEENGGRTVTTVTVRGIIENNQPPENLSIRINDGVPYTNTNLVKVEVRADGASKMIISKNPLRPRVSSVEWVPYEEVIDEYDLGISQGTITLYAWFIDEYGNINDDIVKANVIYDKEPPTTNRPTLTASGPYMIVEINQTDNIDSVGSLEKYFGYRLHVTGEGTEDDYIFTVNSSDPTSKKCMIGPLENGKEYDFKTKAVDKTGNSSVSETTTMTVKYDYIINFNMNGGTSGDNEFETMYAIEGSTITLPTATPSRIGYDFVGWSEKNDESPDNTANIFGAGNSYTPTGNIINKTLYAIWSPRNDIPYTIFHYAESEITAGEYEKIYKEDLQGTTAQMAVAQYKDETFNGAFEGLVPNNSYPGTVTEANILGDGSTVLKLYYTRKQSKLTVIAQNGTATGSSANVKYETIVNLTSTANVGYMFDRWYASKDDGATTLPDSDPVYECFISDNKFRDQNTGFKMPAYDITLIANYKIKTYSITYELNGGTVGTANPTEYNRNTPTFTLNNPTKNGYNFIGWTGADLIAVTPEVTVNPATLVVMDDRNYVANFEPADDLLTITATPETPTSGIVEVAVSCLDPELKVLYKVGESAWRAYTSIIEISENTVVYVKAVKDDILVDEKSRAISNIDKIKPVISDIKVSDDWEAGTSLKLTVTATDNLELKSGLATLTNVEPNKSSFGDTLDDIELSGDGLNYIWISDEAGNVAVEKVYAWDISEHKDKKMYAVSINKEDFEIVGEGNTKSYADGGTPYESLKSTFKNVVINNGVIKLNNNVLSKMTNVEEIIIPTTLESISEDAISYTNNFKNINVASDNQHFSYENFTLYDKDKSVIYVHSKADSNLSFEIKSSVEEIKKLAFYDNDNLRRIDARRNANIGPNAFENASNLMQIEGEIGGTKISENAFLYAKALEILTLSSYLNEIGAGAFKNTVKLTNLTIPKSVTVIGASGVFENIGTSAGTTEGKGTVRYYQSCAAMKEYVRNNPGEANFVMIDDIASSLVSFEFESPIAAGTYPAGTALKFILTFDEDIDRQRVPLPTLTIKIGSGAEINVSDIRVEGEKVIYTYIAKEADEGKVQLVSLSGNVHDMVGNATPVSITSPLEKEVFIESIIKLEEGANTYYFTKLQDAIDAATNNPESASKITILKNITENVEVTSLKNINLNLNGKTLSFEDGKNGIANKGTLEIGGTGKIVAADYVALQNTGRLKLNDVEIQNDLSETSIVNNSSAELELNGTKISTNSTSIENNGTLEINGTNISSNGTSIENNGTLEINGTNISSKSTSIENNETLAIEGATITSNTSSAILAESGSNTNIVSGDINYSGDLVGAGIEVVSTANVYITNANISAPNGNGIINEGKLEVTGAVDINAKRNLLNKNVASIAELNATNTDDSEPAIKNEGGTLTIAGGEITSNVTSALINVGGTVTLGNNANITSTATTDCIAIINESASTLIIEGASVNGNCIAIENKGTIKANGGMVTSSGASGMKLVSGDVNIDGTNISVNKLSGADTAIGLDVYNSTISLNNATINVISTAGSSEGVKLQGGSVDIENSNITVTGAQNQNIGIHNLDGTVNIGANDGVINKESEVIDSKNYGYLGEAASIVNYYDGKFVAAKDMTISGENVNILNKAYIKTELNGTRETAYLDTDLDAPINVTLEADKTTWTNTAITLTGKATDNGSGIVAYAFTKSNVTPNGDEWESLTPKENSIVKTKAITEYGIYYFHVKDAVGNTAVSNAVEAKYDNVAPRITGITISPNYATNQDVTATVNAVDTLSGIVGYEFSKVSHGTTPTSGECNFVTMDASRTISKVFLADESCDWYIYLIDAAGNILYTKQTISNVDKVAPRIAITVENITDDNIKLKVVATDDKGDIASITVNGVECAIEPSSTEERTAWTIYDINNPGEYVIVATDDAGNKATESRSAYIIAYDSNNKSGEVMTQLKFHETAVEIKSNPFTNEGFVFGSWNTKADGTGTRYLPSSAYSNDENITLYAIWEDVTSPVILDVTLSENFVAGNNPLLKVTAVDNDKVTGYAITTTNTAPSTWNDSNEVTAIAGDGKYYIWVKDAAGKVGMTEIEIYDISKADEAKSVFGIIKKDVENAAKVTLEIDGVGGTNSYDAENIPWKDSLNKITDVYVKEGVTAIGDGVLSNLENTKTIIIQDTVADIGLEAFVHTNNFNEILIDGNNFIYENGMLLDGDKETLYVAGKNTTGSKVTVPNTVTTIAPYTFEENRATEIVLTQNIDIPEGAFKNATNLVKISADNGIGGTKISESAFEGATNIESVDISENLEYIGDRAFYDATKLREITIPASVTTISGDNVFTNIGKDAGNPDGKGIVYYYESCDPMVEYATNLSTKDQATFILIDDVKPVIETFLINSGDEITGDKNVTLTIKATDNHMVSAMIITADASFVPTETSTEWVAYSESASYELSAGTGTKTLYLWVKDNSNNICVAKAEDSIFYVEYELELTAGDTVVQYVDRTGKNYYDYRDRGYRVSGDNVTVEVDDSAVDHNTVGDYEVKYKVIYDGRAEIGTATRKVEVIANDWNTTTYTVGKYKFVLHKSKPYAKIVGYQSDKIATELVLPESFNVLETEYKVIDAGSLSARTGLSIGGDEVKISKLTLGKNMIAVSDYAFSNFTALRELDYGDALMTIGRYAFSKNFNSNFTSGNQKFATITVKLNVRVVRVNAFRGVGIDHLIIEDGVKSIEDGAFLETIGIEDEVLNIPASVEYIGNGTFGGRAVSEINVADENTSYKDSGEKLLLSANGKDLLLYAGRRSDTELIIPEGVEYTTTASISRATNLINVTLPSSMKRLRYATFRYDTKLERVTGGENLTHLDGDIFCNTSLKYFEIPAGVTVIGGGAFRATLLENVFIHADVTDIQGIAYAFTPTLNSVVIGGTPTIDGTAFNGRTALKYLVMLDSGEIATIGATTNIPAGTKVYVVNADMESRYENNAIWKTLGADRIELIAKLNGEEIVELDYNSTYTEEGITLFDETFSSGEGTSTKVKDFAVTKSGAVDTSTVGTYEIKYTVTYRGNKVVELVRQVKVEDVTPPTITDISTAGAWVPGNSLVLTITADDDVDDTANLKYAVTNNINADGATWSASKDVTVSAGTNYIHVKDSSGNITTQKVEAWDISKTGSNNVVAYLKEDGELTACGNGDTKIIARGNAPWKAYRADITTLTIEEGVQGINHYIFSDLDAASIINISASAGRTENSTSKISTTAFAGTNNFDEINIASGNDIIKCLDDGYTVVSKGGSITLLHSRKDPATTYVIEYIRIAESAFEKNNNITKLEFEIKSSISDYAFRECLNLATISGEIGNTRIGTGAFSGDINLRNITISKTVTTLGTGIFTGVPGPVYYYASCDAMVNYARIYSGETDFRVIDDVAPTDDAPTLKASSATIMVTSNQRDLHSGIANVKYAIVEGSGDGWAFQDATFQDADYFTGLKADTYYTVRTLATDNEENTAYSQPTTIKTEKVPDSINITASPTEPTKGDVTVTIEWPQTIIDELYSGDWPAGTNVTKQIKIEHSGGASATWNNATQDVSSEDITVSENGTTVYARLYDGVNATVKTISLTVDNIDRVKPTGTVVINSGDATTFETAIKLNLTATDNFEARGYGVKYYYASENSTVPSSDRTLFAWKKYSGDGVYDFEISETRGEKTVYVWFMDYAGNVSDTYSDTIKQLPNAVRLEQNGTTEYYDKLSDAVAEVVMTSPAPAVASRLTLLKNITGENVLTIENTKNIVIDMNGFNIEYTGNAEITGISNYGRLRIENTDVTKETSIKIVTTSGNATGVYNEGTVDVDGVSIKTEAPSGKAIGIHNYGID